MYIYLNEVIHSFISLIYVCLKAAPIRLTHVSSCFCFYFRCGSPIKQAVLHMFHWKFSYFLHVFTAAPADRSAYPAPSTPAVTCFDYSTHWDINSQLSDRQFWQLFPVVASCCSVNVQLARQHFLHWLSCPWLLVHPYSAVSWHCGIPRSAIVAFLSLPTSIW